MAKTAALNVTNCFRLWRPGWTFAFIGLAVFTAIAAAEEPKPFDRLGRDHVTLKVKPKKSGSSADYDYKASWGSYDRNVTSFKEFEVRVEQQRAQKFPTRIEFFSVIKSDADRFARRVGEKDLPTGEGEASFSISAEQNQQKWVYTSARRETSGERIEGWLVRAVSEGRIVGVAASSPSLEELAVNPEKLNPLLSAGKKTAGN